MSRFGVFAIFWCSACGEEVVQLHESRRYEPISCSPKGFTLYNVDGFMWEYEVDSLGWTAFAKPMDFSKEWATESSAEKPVYVQHFSDGVHYVYNSRVVTVQGDARAEYPLQGGTHPHNFFQMKDGVVSVQNTSLDGLKFGDELMSAFTFCDFMKPHCETKLWPPFIDIAGDMSMPILLSRDFALESYREFFRSANESGSIPSHQITVAPNDVWERTITDSSFTQGNRIAFGVNREGSEAGILVTTDTLDQWRYIRLMELTYDPFGVCREANRFPWGFGNESCMYTPIPEVSRVCILDDGGIIAQVSGEQQFRIFLVR